MLRIRAPRMTASRALAASIFLMEIGGSLAYASIGDSEENCERRYGASINSKEKMLAPATVSKAYTVNSWLLVIHFWKGVAQAMSYAKRDGSQISRTEAQEILAGAGSGLGWSRGNSQFDYVRSDNQIRVLISDESVTVFTMEFYKAVSTATADVEARKAHEQTLKVEIKVLKDRQNRLTTQLYHAINDGNRPRENEVRSIQRQGTENDAILRAKQAELDQLMHGGQ